MRNQVVAAACCGLLFCSSVQSNADTFGRGDDSFEIEFVTIGDAGNAPDESGEPNPAGRRQLRLQDWKI